MLTFTSFIFDVYHVLLVLLQVFFIACTLAEYHTVDCTSAKIFRNCQPGNFSDLVGRIIKDGQIDIEVFLDWQQAIRG